MKRGWKVELIENHQKYQNFLLLKLLESVDQYIFHVNYFKFSSVFFVFLVGSHRFFGPIFRMVILLDIISRIYIGPT